MRVARCERSRRRDEGTRRALQRQGREHALLLDVGRPHRVGARGDRRGRAVPRLGRGSLRHALALPRLGPRAVRREGGREAAEAVGAGLEHVRRDRRVRPGEERRCGGGRRHAGHADGQPGAAAARAPSTWFSPALLQLSPTARTITTAARSRSVGRSTAPTMCRSRRSRRAVPGPMRGRCRLRRTGPRARRQAAGSTRPARVGRARAGLAKVGVAARVSAVVTPQGVQGTLRPVAPGAPVQLQERQDDGTWATLLDKCRHGVRVVLPRLALGRRLPRPGGTGPRRQRGRVRAVHRAVRRLRSRRACGARAPRGGSGVRKHRAVRGPGVVPRPGRGLVVLADDAEPRSGQVAIVDSGIDGRTGSRGRVVAARSFVGGSPYHDEQGHGTFVAGEIAATRRTRSVWPASRSTPV